MGWWNKRLKSNDDSGNKSDDDWNAFLEVRKAQMEWARARILFDEARGEDEIDYAIYILEAAERKYQIHLKHAKQLGLNRVKMQAGE